MLTHTAPAFIAIAAALASSACRKNEEKTSSDLAGKAHERVRATREARISDYQRKRIRSTLESASRPNQEETAISEFERLLHDYPSDTVFLRELATQVFSESYEMQQAFVAALVRVYSAGEYRQLGEAISTLKDSGKMGGLLIEEFARALVDFDDGKLVLRAYDELLARPASKEIQPSHYSIVASASAKQLGPVAALARIPDTLDGRFGTVSAQIILTLWTRHHPVEASSYVRDLPPSVERDSLITHMVDEVANTGDLEMARSWADYLQGEAREKALDHIRIREAILKRREEREIQREEMSQPSGAPAEG